MTHDEHLRLNAVQRDGYKDQREVKGFDLLKKRRWIQHSTSFGYRGIFDTELWELSSAGRLVYEKENSYSDGCKRKRERRGCPRCADMDSMCPICLGYTADGKLHNET